MRKMDQNAHDQNQLREIQKEYYDIAAYVDITDPDTLFLGSLPEESVSNLSSKK